MHTIKAGGLCFSVSEDAASFYWSAEGLPLRSGGGADFWRAFMDDGERREMTVHSSGQRGRVTEEEDGLAIRYGELSDGRGRIFRTALTVHIRAATEGGAEGFEMWADIDNSDGARLNEMQLPFVDLETVADRNLEKDILYRMNGLGERIENPWEALKASHTEYMAADYDEIWTTDTYPNDASMCWFGVESGGRFLYVGRHEAQYRSATLAAGVSPRHAPPRLILAISHYPAARRGEKLRIARCFVALGGRDWRFGSDIYSSWARRTWYTVPEKPQWVKDFTGWQRIILKHQYGEIFFRYEDLPRIYLEGKKCGLDTLMVFGWWKGRFDNGYPLYEADPALGGEKALKEAVAKVQSLGGRVALYTNGILIDVTSDFYKETGCRICRKDLDGNEYRDHYRFANDGTMLRNFGYKSFVTACHATPEWKARLLENGRIKQAFHPDSLFFDQIGGHVPLPCFDSRHLHGPRVDEEAKWKVENLKALRRLCENGQALGSENTVDLYAPCLDYHHGCQLGPYYGDKAEPDLFLRTFPEPIMTNRFLHDDRDDFRRMLNHAFLYGFRFDVSIYRGRKRIVTELPAFASYLGELIALKEKYHKFFYGGRFTGNPVAGDSRAVRIREYESPDGARMFAVWNDTDVVQKVATGGIPLEVGPQSVACAAAGNTQAAEK